MRAAGLLALAALLPGAAIALTDLARGTLEWDDDDREFVEGTLEQLAQRFGKPANAC